MSIDYPVSLLIWNGALLLAGAAGGLWVGKQFNIRWFLIALVLFNVNAALVLNFFGLNSLFYGLIGNPDTQFNWAGKITALCFSAAILTSGLIQRQAAGVTFRQSNRAHIGWLVLLILCLIDIYIAIQLDNERHSLEAITYQLFMPSLEEELFYRGILLFALLKAFGEGPRFLAARFGWAALIGSLLFGTVHSLFWADGELVFSVETFFITGALGLVLTWLRLNTGSVVAPILLHSAINVFWRII